MLEHQFNNIIKRDKLQSLTHVDLSVGRDHGSGKFRMMLKILFRFHESATISWLFQITSVSHSKDDTKILDSTALKPNGERLRRISQGGHFILHHDINDSLSVSFYLNINSVE